MRRPVARAAGLAVWLAALALSACSVAWGDEELQDGICPDDMKACYEECVPLNRANLGCARSGCAPCNLPHAVAICAPSGDCSIGTCQNDFRDCDSMQPGCETDTNHDPDNCGGCGQGCVAVPNATPGCTAGTCTAAACASGFKDCNKKYLDGCEVDVTQSSAHCGDCNTPCDAPMSCVAGMCQ